MVSNSENKVNTLITTLVALLNGCSCFHSHDFFHTRPACGQQNLLIETASKETQPLVTHHLHHLAF